MDGGCVLARDTGVRGLGQETVHEIAIFMCSCLTSSAGQFWLSYSATCVRCAIFSLENTHFIVRQLALESNSVLGLPLIFPTVTLEEQG